MIITEIAKRVVELNRANDHMTVYSEFYTDETVSVENWGGKLDTYKGMEAIGEKGKKWMEDIKEMHSVTCSEPLVSDSSFAITFSMDVTYKSRGRVAETEMAIYTVKDGKIIREEFQA